MALFKCKMCGGDLDVTAGVTVCECAYCGTQQTLPKLDDDKRANMYDRANHFRRNNEFDKAMGIYEQILNEDSTDAEAYWSLVLCRYGIEYVEDPSTKKRVPTVNRAQFTSVFDDDNYRSALQHADPLQKALYEAEANSINEIQKGILAISQKEEPFDIFICYKETDNNGRRTPDSVLANDLYHQLTQEGFNVFFARITLEDKLGSAYEPYIFAALNSAKVMVVLGTKPEYFNAVWVKNEWSRYLALIKQGQKKILIPAYKDMDPYDLPEEFSHLQAQDMSKLGFMQDLIRGIQKLTHTDAPAATVVRETVVAPATGGNIASLLTRAFMFLEDGDWQSADEYCEKVLDIDPKNAEAYVGKLMAELHVRKQDDLKYQDLPFDDNSHFQKALRFADDAMQSQLRSWVQQNEEYRNECAYNTATTAMMEATDEDTFLRAARLFQKVGDYKDAATQATLCEAKAQEASNLAFYNDCVSLYQQACSFETEYAFSQAAQAFTAIPHFRDAEELRHQCLIRAEECRKDAIYQEALRHSENNTAKEQRIAAELFEQILDWRDAAAQRDACLEKEKALHLAAEKAARRNRMIAAVSVVCVALIIVFSLLTVNVFIPNTKYKEALRLVKDGEYIKAYEALIALDGYKDSSVQAAAIFDEYKAAKLKASTVGDYVFFGTYEQDNDTANGKEDIEWLVLEVKDGKALLISKYALDCKQYNTSYSSVTWETCTLRTWLNHEFINAAFTAEEQAKIPTVTVTADANPSYDTNPGNATQDQVFLFSIAEANKHFNSDDARQCAPTNYAVANGAYKSSGGNCWWWLRSPGSYQVGAARVSTVGDVYEFGYVVDGGVGAAVRPALWIDLNA